MIKNSIKEGKIKTLQALKWRRLMANLDCTICQETCMSYEALREAFLFTVNVLNPRW